MHPPYLIDTNIILRFLTGDDVQKQQAATKLFERVERKEISVLLDKLVVAEVVYVLSSPRHYHKTREEVRLLLQPLLALENIKVENRRTLLRSLDIYATCPIDFIDAYLKAAIEGAPDTVLFSYDTDFDRFPDITRKEPEVSEKDAA